MTCGTRWGGGRSRPILNLKTRRAKQFPIRSPAAATQPGFSQHWRLNAADSEVISCERSPTSAADSDSTRISERVFRLTFPWPLRFRTCRYENRARVVAKSWPSRQKWPAQQHRAPFGKDFRIAPRSSSDRRTFLSSADHQMLQVMQPVRRLLRLSISTSGCLHSRQVAGMAQA